MGVELFSKKGKIIMLALDHRSSLINLMPADSVTEFKKILLETLSPLYSGVLLDPVRGLSAYRRSRLRSVREKPYLLCIEKTGYEDVGKERLTKLEYSVSQLRNLGAGGIKLLLFYRPDAKTADKQIEVARQVLNDCRKNNLPFFLEILNYPLDGKPYDASKLVPVSVQNLLENGVAAQVFKIEFPGTARACRVVTKLLGNTPWILLTKGDSYNRFVTNLRIAAANGCRGFLAGRSIWQDTVCLPLNEMRNFMNTVVKERFSQISRIVQSG